MLSSTNTVADVETLYARLGERDYEAVMSYLADDIVWIVADNSPLADRSPYNGLGEVRSGVFERLTAGFDKLVFDADEMFECNAARELWLSATIISGFMGKLRNARRRSPTSGRSATVAPLSSSNTSIRSRLHATREQSKAPGPRFCLTYSFYRILAAED